MTQAVFKKVQCISPIGLHSMVYKEWGDPDNLHVLVCLHGMTRVSDDFDVLANSLCKSYRVICPDIVGCGRSEYLRDPKYYTILQYVNDIIILLARLDAKVIDWLGTSIGGLIGIILCSFSNHPIRRLILNDIGPAVNLSVLMQIRDHMNRDIRFDTFDEAAHYIRTISVHFGPHTNSEWYKLAADVLCQDSNGKWMQNYDFNLVKSFQTITSDSVNIYTAMLWTAYDAIRCPTLLIRGKQSNVLSSEIAQAMTKRGPLAKLVEFENIGHAPTFVHINQIKIIENFLFD